MKQIKEIGLIGFGDFGRFIFPYLKDYAEVSVYDAKEIHKKSSLEETASKDLVVLSVPVQNLEEVLVSIKDYVKEDALVADVCSVKLKPCQLMEKYLPKTAEIIGTHPLFGPQSGKYGIMGQKIVICPVRTSSIDSISSFLYNAFESNVILSTPEEHDRQMAYVQGLTHFIAKALDNMKLPAFNQSTKAYELLLELKELLSKDSEELFWSIQKENPYAKDVRIKFLDLLFDLETFI